MIHGIDQSIPLSVISKNFGFFVMAIGTQDYQVFLIVIVPIAVPVIDSETVCSGITTYPPESAISIFTAASTFHEDVTTGFVYCTMVIAKGFPFDSNRSICFDVLFMVADSVTTVWHGALWRPIFNDTG
jgi:hypothetical protein